MMFYLFSENTHSGYSCRIAQNALKGYNHVFSSPRHFFKFNDKDLVVPHAQRASNPLAVIGPAERQKGRIVLGGHPKINENISGTFQKGALALISFCFYYALQIAPKADERG